MRHYDESGRGELKRPREWKSVHIGEKKSDVRAHTRKKGAMCTEMGRGRERRSERPRA